MTVETLSRSKDQINVLLLEGIHPAATATFGEAGYTSVRVHDKALQRAELREALSEVHFLGIRSRTQIDAELLAATPKLVGVGCFCIGTNQVDLDAAANQGIPVFNAPFSNTRSVAELVIAEIIMLIARDSSKKRGGSPR